MRNFEKELIAKIQISNLVSDDPYLNDFYYLIHTMNNKDVEEQPLTDKDLKQPKQSTKLKKQMLINNQLVSQANSVAVTDQMKKQMKRLVESRKSKPAREDTLSLEGALGKISVNSARNPKRAFGGSHGVVSASQTFSTEKICRSSTLRNVENVYDVIISLEKLHLAIPNSRSEALCREWDGKVNENKQRLFVALKVMEKVELT
jgi:hypothetical protein